MKRLAVALSILLFLLIPFLSSSRPVTANPSTEVTPTPPLEPVVDPRDEVERAIREAVAGKKNEVLAFLVYQVQIDNVNISADGGWATAYLILANPENGESLPTEPGLVITQKEGDAWRAILPSDPGWPQAVRETPADLLPDAAKEMWLAMFEEGLAELPKEALRGYLLPWEAGKIAYLSGSTSHDSYIPSRNAHYAFDFYIPQTMFNLFASKAGVVWLAKDDVPNGYENDSNYLIIKDETTAPTTYQLYLHLAQGSIPPSLRTPGATVVQGQFIGVADDTGASTGHHLHFQVQVPMAGSLWWGRSVDVVFDEVNINGGRPRRNDSYVHDFAYCTLPGDVCVSSKADYISANVPAGDIYIPNGGLDAPAPGLLIQQPSLNIYGWANDVGSGLYNAQLRAFFNNSWHDIGPAFGSSPFSYSWDMCADGVPDGPVSLAVRAMDMDGNQNHLAGLRHLAKNFACSPPPAPACEPGQNQVALYTARNFEGACRVYGVGDYPNLDSLGDNSVASIQVGAKVKATLFIRTNYERRGETFEGDDIFLNNNRVAAFTASSMKVMLRSAAPAVPLHVWPADGQTLTKFDSINLSWMDAGGATRFQARYSGPGGTVTSDWLAETFWSLGNLRPGSYTWQVRASSPDSAWSSNRILVVQDSAPTPPAAVTAPFSDNMEGGSNRWTSSGLWHLEDGPAPVEANSGTHFWWFGTSTSGSEQYASADPGDLTSKPILFPVGAAYSLRFWYRYQTETTSPLWDQRWLSISVDGGPFEELLQLSDDPQDTWLRSPNIDLSAYAGHTVRLRFHFHALDANFNTYEGWYIDDVSITTDLAPSCAGALEPNNTPGQAVEIAYGQAVEGVICPAGDVDFYHFAGSAGDRVVVDVDAVDVAFHNSKLDAVASLLDSDGVNALAEHDDEVYGKQKDPHLGFRLPHSGDFYIKIIAWNHPGAGGSDYSYRIRLSTDSDSPAVSILAPFAGAYLDANPFTILVQAGDEDGISRVEFMAHTSEWMNTGWVMLGSDSDGSDGWSFPYDSAGQPEGHQAAFFVRAYDWAGNWSGTLTWDLGIDRTPPMTSIYPLPSLQDSTAFQVVWTGYDAISSIDHYDLQWKAGSGSWQNYALDIPSTTTRLWVVGQLGQSYAFRLRAADRMGNLGSYPADAQATTFIPGSVCSSPDEYEPPGNDNSPAASTLLNPGESQIHNFCNPLSSSKGLNDEDWLMIAVQAGRRYRFLAFPQAGSAAAVVGLYADDGETLLAQASAQDFGKAIALNWTALQDGLLFLRVRPYNGQVAGNPVNYRVSVMLLISEIRLPVIVH